MGGGGAPSNVTSYSQPWVHQGGPLKRTFETAEELGGVPLRYFPGSTVADMDPAQLEALGLTEGRARAGSPLVRGAQGYTQDVLGGRYLGSNPFLDQMYDRAAQGVTRNFNLSVLPAIETRFGAAGGLGNSSYGAALGESARALGGELSGLATDIYGENYERERGRMETARAAARDLADADYQDLAMLGAVGDERRSFSQQMLDDQVKRFNFEQQEPWERLRSRASIIGGLPDFRSTGQTNPNSGGPGFWQNLLQGVLSSAAQGAAGSLY